MPSKERQPLILARGTVRINRYLALCGITSRRKAEQLVLEGRVALNGKPVSNLATKVRPGRDRVTVDKKPVAAAEHSVYLVLNKPKDTITTLHDEKGRKTVMSLVQSQYRVFPIGRLDRNTTGVLLLTNDGEFANGLMHPARRVPKVYHVTSITPVAEHHLRELRAGVRLEDGMTAPARVEFLPGHKGKVIAIAISEGRNRQVRRMFEALGYEVEKLDRFAYGPVTKSGLARGEVRTLTRGEVRALKEMAGIKEEW